VLVRPGRDRLSGTVEADETFIGGDEPGLRGGRARGKKVLTGIAVELAVPKGIGRCRMEVLADASAGSLNPFITGAVEPGSTVITDAWMGYHGLAAKGYVHERRSQRAARARGDDPGELLPAVHRLASLAKRWLLGTHQGRVDEAHLQSYLSVRLPLQPPPPGRAAAWSSTGSWSWPPCTTRSGSRTSSPPGSRTRSRQRAAGDTRRALTAPQRTGHGGPASFSCSYRFHSG
jgi:ISXO2-like transposase domain